MKRPLQFILLFFALAFFQACEGPEGEVGPQGEPGVPGPTGPAGAATPAQVLDFPVNFTAPNYQFGFGFEDNDIIVGEDDVVLTYMNVYTGGTAQAPVFYWSPMPQTFFVTEKPVKYNSAYNNEGLVIILEASTEMKAALSASTTLKAAYLDNQGFRAVIIPGKQLRTANGGKQKFDPKDYPVDFNNYEEVAKFFNLPKEAKKITKFK